jgi:hypothetical protein
MAPTRSLRFLYSEIVIGIARLIRWAAMAILEQGLRLSLHVDANTQPMPPGIQHRRLVRQRHAAHALLIQPAPRRLAQATADGFAGSI